MGSGFSRFSPCCCQQPPSATTEDLIFAAAEEPLDETLGHSFCYVRSSARFVSPCHSDRFSPNSHSPSHPQSQIQTSTNTSTITGFKSISGASVSANTSTPRTVLPHDHIYDEAITSAPPASDSTVITGGFQSTSNFSALPLLPVPHGDGERGFFMSGPIERGALSGPLDPTTVNFDHAGHGQVPFSAPLNGLYVKRKRKKGLSGITKAFHSEKKKPWVVPVLNFVGRRDGSGQNVTHEGAGDLEVKNTTIDNNNVQWAHGKAGEDRVQVVVSEEHGWLFVGIYDGFNGPDAPEFLMGNLYRAVFNELQGLFWEVVENVESNVDGFGSIGNAAAGNDELVVEGGGGGGGELELEMQLDPPELRSGSVKRVTFQSEKIESTTKRLWEFLAEEQADDGLDLSGSERFAFSVDDAVRVSNAGSTVKKRSLLLSKLKYGFSKHKEGQGHSRRFFPWRYDWEDKDKPQEENTVGERTCQSLTKRSVGPVDHELVLRALSQALDVTELAYLDMTDKVLDRNPELALMGSCLLVVLMRDEDVYVMNVGDSRAIVAQYQPHPIGSSAKVIGHGSRLDSEDIVEESIDIGDRVNRARTEASAEEMKLTALQLSTDHSTSIEEEVLRIKEEHPDDNHCIVNDRVKGRLKVTRAFGAGFLKQPKLNDALLEMFRNEYIGTAPYISCSPSLCHHKLGPNDQFLILSSDGLYQYLSNEEVVSNVESFMEKFPDGDPAQHLIEELLFRAAKKAGMEFHELLDIPQGDRRKYHDDVTVMVISLEGRIWKSSGKYL